MKRKRSSEDDEESEDFTTDDEDMSLLEVKRRRADIWTNYLVDEATGSAVCVLCLESYKLDRQNGRLVMCAGMVEHYERGCGEEQDGGSDDTAAAVEDDPLADPLAPSAGPSSSSSVVSIPPASSVVTECSVVLERLSPALLQKYTLPPDFDTLTPGSLSDEDVLEVVSDDDGGMKTPSFSDSEADDEDDDEDEESTEEMTKRLLAKYDVVDESPPTPSPSSSDNNVSDPTEMDEISQTLNQMYDLNKRPKRKASLERKKPFSPPPVKTRQQQKQQQPPKAPKPAKKEETAEESPKVSKVIKISVKKQTSPVLHKKSPSKAHKTPVKEVNQPGVDMTEHFILRGYFDVSDTRPQKKREVWSKFLVNEKLKSAVCKKCFRKYKLNNMNKRGGLVVGMVNHVENNCVRQTPGGGGASAAAAASAANRFASPAVTAAKSKAVLLAKDDSQVPDLGDLEWSVIKELFPDDVPDDVNLNETLNQTLNGSLNQTLNGSLSNHDTTLFQDFESKQKMQYFLERGYVDVSLTMSDRRKKDIWSMFLVNKDIKKAACKYCFAVYKMAKYTNMGIGAGMSKHVDKGCGIRRGRKSKGGGPGGDTDDFLDPNDIEMKVYQEMLEQEAAMYGSPRSPSPEPAVTPELEETTDVVVEEEEEDFSEEHKAKIQTYISKGFEDGAELIGSMHKNLSTWRNYLAHRTTKVAICKRCFKVFTLDPRSQLGLKSSMTKHAESRCGTLKPGEVHTPKVVAKPALKRPTPTVHTPSIRRSLPGSSLRIKLMAQKVAAKLRARQLQEVTSESSSTIVPLERQTTEDLITYELMLEELLKAEWLPTHWRSTDQAPVKKRETVLPLERVLDMPGPDSDLHLFDDSWDLDTCSWEDSDESSSECDLALPAPAAQQIFDSQDLVECPGATYSQFKWRGQLTYEQLMLVEALSAEITADIPT